MSKKEIWLTRLAEYQAKNGDTITIKELSAITWNGKRNTMSYEKIYKDCKKGILPFTQLGNEDSKCSITIDLQDAEKYLKGFYFSNEDLTPPTKPLFPGFVQEKLLKTA